MSEIQFFDSDQVEHIIPVDKIHCAVRENESYVTLLYNDAPIFTRFMPLKTLNGQTRHLHTADLLALNDYDGRIFPFGHYNNDNHSEFQHITMRSWAHWHRYIFSRLIHEGAFDSTHQVDPVRSIAIKYVWIGGDIEEPKLDYTRQLIKKPPNPYKGLDFLDSI